MTDSSPPSSESPYLSDSPSFGFDDANESFLSQLTSSDPLSYLLQVESPTHNTRGPSSAEQDWSPFTSWLENVSIPQDKAPEIGLPPSFDFSIPMNLDFDSSMAIDPSSLHFNTSIFTQHQPGATPAFDSTGSFKPEPFTQLLDQHVTPINRRLSVTSSSSSSGPSFSPVIKPHSTPGSSIAGDTSSNEDIGAEIAQRVLQATGAVFSAPQDTKVESNTSQPKMPIPRLPRPDHTIPTSTQSPLSTIPTIQANSETSIPTVSVSSVLGRLKTSHTTIERRYRTNLNARITGLKQSVPALRVLEARLSGKDPAEIDVVDERGFVDGVKVGRKMSKANVLGKATEYIKVLKRRETRLRHEQVGLKSLIVGLANGPALLQTWEIKWRETFGGEEKDEIEEEMGSDEDGDGDDDEDEDSSRPKKKARTVKVIKDKPVKQQNVTPPASRPLPLTPSVLPEKRKRGRPRKIPVPVPTSAMVTSPPLFASVDHEISPSNGQSRQYLLAVFAFMSFFNSSSKSSFTYSQPHSHKGVVLDRSVPVDFGAGNGWRDVIQIFHLLVSVLVFFSIVVPWIPNSLKRTSLFPSILRPLNLHNLTKTLYVKRSPSSSGSDRDTLSPVVQDLSQPNVGIDRMLLLDALSLVGQSPATEAAALRKALGISSGVVGLCQGVVKAGKRDRGIELNQLEQRAWVRLGELVSLDDAVSTATRLQTYWGMAWHISTFSASATDLATLALIVRPISSSRASRLWERAGKRELLRPYEKLVFDTLDAHEAAHHLNWWCKSRSELAADAASSWSAENYSPLRALAQLITLRRLKKHASVLFIKSVDGDRSDRASSSDDSDENCLLDAVNGTEDEVQRTQTLQAGRSLGGTIAELASAFEKVWELGSCRHDDLPSLIFTHEEGDVKDLLSAVVLYRAIFTAPSIHSSECVDGRVRPPSPVQKNGESQLALRKLLGSTAFEMRDDNENERWLSLVLEDARDAVVDMLIDSRIIETLY